MIETGHLPEPQSWHLWHDTLTLLDLAARRGGIEPWAEGDLLWLAVDGGEVIGAATSRLLDNGNAELKNVAGTRVHEWHDRLEDQICEWARCHACPLIVSRGRAGWWPLVSKLGWQRVGTAQGLTLYEKEL